MISTIGHPYASSALPKNEVLTIRPDHNIQIRASAEAVSNGPAICQRRDVEHGLWMLFGKTIRGRARCLVHTNEPSLTNKIDSADDLQRGDLTPAPKSQQRRYSVDWDPLQ